MATDAFRQTFAAWIAQVRHAPPDSEFPIRPEDVIDSVCNGLYRVAASLNGVDQEVRSLSDDALRRALKKQGLGRIVAAGLEIPFAGLTVKERHDYVFHPNRFDTRRVENFTRLEITPTVDFLNAIIAGFHPPEEAKSATDKKACLAAWVARYAFHTLAHQRQGITATNRGVHAGTSRLHADFEADLESLIHLVHAFGFEPSSGGSPLDPGVVALMKKQDCCSAFKIRRGLRGQPNPKEVNDRLRRSTAGRISSKLVLNNVTPMSVIVAEQTPSGVRVIINNCLHEALGRGAKSPEEIADAMLRRYRDHLAECHSCQVVSDAHLKAKINSLKMM